MLKKLPKMPYFIFFLVILILFLFVKVFFLSTEDKPADFFPDALMVKSFKGTLDNDEFTHIVDRIENNKIQIRQINGNTNVAMVYEISNDMIQLVYTLEEDELKDDYITNLKKNRNDTIIKSPLTIGTHWKDNIGGAYGIIEVNRMIKTPAGEFETLVVEYHNDDFNVREYYARKIGLVKIVINNYLVNELVDIKIYD